MCSHFLHISLCLRANQSWQNREQAYQKLSSLWALWAQSPNDILLYVFCVLGAPKWHIFCRKYQTTCCCCSVVAGLYTAPISNNLLSTLFIPTLISGIPDWEVAILALDDSEHSIWAVSSFRSMLIIKKTRFKELYNWSMRYDGCWIWTLKYTLDCKILILVICESSCSVHQATQWVAPICIFTT